jgi:hypothetical protein
VVVVQGKLIDPWHVELADAVPPGTDAIEIRLVNGQPAETPDIPLLTRNPSFDFLRDEPDLYE